MSSTTIRDIALDDSGDIDLSSGDLRLVSGAEAIRQSLRIRAQFFKGEWFLDPTAGLPYFEEVLVKNPDPNQLQTVFNDLCLGTTGVTRVVKLELSLDNATRKLSVQGTLDSDVGLLDFALEV